MSYVFYCSRCRFDHAGECSSQNSYIAQMIDDITSEGWKVTTYDGGSITLVKNVKLATPLTFIPITFYRTGVDSEFEG